MLPAELLNKRNRRFSVRIGNCMSVERLRTFKSDADMIQYLRLRCHILAHRGRAKPEIELKVKTAHTPVIGPVLPSEDSEVLAREVNCLPQEQRLVRSEHFHVYYAAASQVPELLREIGRLREITFCAAGEGTGRLLDLDRFDAYYFHLFLWNDKSHELVGAYRFGLTDAIVRRFGVRGLYTNTPFKYGKSLLDQLDPAIELGRSFVRPEYQKAYAPLLLLWRGIGQFVVRNPRYRYVFGPVSISREYNAYSRHLLSAFLQINNLDEDKARVIRARNPPRPIDSAECTPQTLRTLVTDLNAVSELIGEIEPDQKTVPVLIRQYLKLGGRILSFNVDPQFNHVLDALMAVDIGKIDPALQARIMTPEGAASYHAARAKMKTLGIRQPARRRA
jgi:putative hemolysin